MKILHTADWHLNDRLGQIDRTPHLRQRVEEIAAICEAESVDLLIVAGDVFSEQAKALAHDNQVADSLRHLRRTFRPFFERGGIILGVTGNHDQDGRIRPALELARAGMDLAEKPRKTGAHFDAGKMYLLDTAFVSRVKDREGFDVQFVLLPYPNLNRVLTGCESASTAAELTRPTQEAVAAWIRSLNTMPGYDPRLRSVFVGHFHVAGAELSTALSSNIEPGGLVLDAAALPVSFDYVALGHIHKPQCLRGLSHIRYSGSPDRMDFAERNEEKSVVLVEIGREGRRGEPRCLPLQSTSLVEITVEKAATSAVEIAAQVPDAATAVVKVTVAAGAVSAGAAVDVAIREALPNVASVKWSPAEAVDDLAARAVAADGSVREKIMDYLGRRLVGDDRDKLLALAGRFLDEAGHR